jgi:hypothetical protein
MAICSLHVLRCGCHLYVSIFVNLLIHIFNRQDTAPHLPLQAGSTVSLNTRQRYQNQPPDVRPSDFDPGYNPLGMSDWKITNAFLSYCSVFCAVFITMYLDMCCFFVMSSILCEFMNKSQI